MQATRILKPTNGANVFPTVDIREAFLDHMRRAVGPLVDHVRAMLAYVPTEGHACLVAGASCSCSQGPAGLTDCLADGRVCQSVALTYRKRSAGTLVLCCPAAAQPAVAASVCHAAGAALRQLELEKENVALRAEHTKSLQTASHIQQTLLLGRPTIDLRSQLRADANSVSALEVGGDFYDFYPYNQILDVVVGDVMGKGVQAALLGAATKNHLLRAVNHLLAENPARLPEPSEILAVVNAEVYRQLAGIESFVTLSFARFDLIQRRLQLIDCGHTRAIHVREEEGTWSFLQGENMPIGFSRADLYKELTVPLKSGDVFFFYTDGVTEARRGGEEFGPDRLGELICSLRALGPRELVERVAVEVAQFSGSRTPQDDLTCVAVKIQDLERSLRSTRAELEIASDLTQLPRVQAFLRKCCEQGLDLTTIAGDLTNLQQAVAAVLANIVRHAYCGQPGKIRIEASLFINRFTVRIYHRGEPFDLDAKAPPAPRKKGDTEVDLGSVRGRVDEVTFARATNGEHCITLQKWLKQ